jgi:hypothetical protein
VENYANRIVNARYVLYFELKLGSISCIREKLSSKVPVIHELQVEIDRADD